jgi:cytoskeletal protein CcmA (bactofilin family)
MRAPRICARRALLSFASLAAITALMVFAFASSGWAIETRTGEDVVIDADEVIEDDLYVGANSVTVEGTVEGDLVAAAGTIRVDGTVEGDVNAAGQTIIIDGTVEDDVRVAGQAVLLDENARITDDVIAFGYSLESRSGSLVGGDLALGSYQALLAGTVEEDVRGGAAGIELDGEVGGNVDVEVDGGGAQDAGAQFAPGPGVPIPDVEPGLTLTDSARIDGDLRYRSSTEADIASGADIGGEVAYERVAREGAEAEPTGIAAVLLGSLRLFATLLVVGALMVWLAPSLVNGAADTLRGRPLLSLGWGVLALAIFAVMFVLVLALTILLAILFGFVTLGGLVATIIGAGVLVEVVLAVAFAVSIVFLAPIVVSFLVGRMLLRSSLPGGLGGRIVALVVGLAIYVVLRAIPILGAIVTLAVVLFGLGALCVWAWRVMRPGRAETSAEG